MTAPTLRNLGRQTDDLIAKLDASMGRMQALVDRLNDRIENEEFDAEPER
jgi:hypothetical protein